MSALGRALLRVDLNCDVGEGAGQDEGLMRLISSANIACGGHAGDDETMRRTVACAAGRGVGIGAHPSLVDREGFGRRELAIAPAALLDQLVSQIRALARIAASEGAALAHVKLHGALYSMAARDEAIARTVVRAVQEATGCRTLFALAGSALVRIARAEGLAVAEEAFADRGYRRDGTLVPRGQPGAMRSDPKEAAGGAISLVTRGMVVANDGTSVFLHADTISLHGDEPHALAFAQAIMEALREAGIEVKRFGAP